MYTDSSFGEIKLHYVVTKVLILNNGEVTLFTSCFRKKHLFQKLVASERNILLANVY